VICAFFPIACSFQLISSDQSLGDRQSHVVGRGGGRLNGEPLYGCNTTKNWSGPNWCVCVKCKG
jgi:hypothetical protein